MTLKKVHIFYKRPFLRKILPKIISMALHEKDMKKKTKPETLKIMFFKKSFPHNFILMIVSSVLHRKTIENKSEN